jgi:hypothetical protein
MAKQPELHAVPDTEPPITVGNPFNAADFVIDQSHLEDFMDDDEGPAAVSCVRPPKGSFFTVHAEIGKPWQNRGFYFLLEVKDRAPYLVLPEIAKQKKEEDVIRPVLLVRYVTMTGTEGLWALKLDRNEHRSNPWDQSAMRILKIAEEGKWVRIISAKGQYHHTVSKKTYAETPPRYSSRPFFEMVDLAFENQWVRDLNHEVWETLAHGAEK